MLGTWLIRQEEFEIFNLCSDHVKRCFDDNGEFNRKIQSIAYNYGIEIEQVPMVYRIELRDYILLSLEHSWQENQEIPFPDN